MRKGFLYSTIFCLAGAASAPAQQPTSLPAASSARADAPAGQPAAPGLLPAKVPSSSAVGVACQPGAPNCDDLGAACRPPCGPEGRCWFGAEYLLWWTKDNRVPALVTGGPASGAGILGQPGTGVLYGGDGIDNGPFSGGRFTAGTWLDCDRTCGVEGSFFFLASRSANFFTGGTAAPGSPVIARPFFNPLTGAEDSQLVAFPGRLGGSAQTSFRTGLWGAEINGLCNLCCNNCCADPCGGYSRVDFLTGFRFLSLDDRLDVLENLTVPAGLPIVGGAGFVVNDQFRTENRFYGGQLGARWEARRGRAFVNVTGKVALGATDQEVHIAGSTAIAPAGGAPVVFPGGLLALPSNIGDYHRTRFSVVPEVLVNVGYQVTDHLRAFVGYTFLYWSSVARPGEQIDRVVNPTQLPIRTAFPVAGAGPVLAGPTRPVATLRDTDFWAQGISFGLELRY